TAPAAVVTIWASSALLRARPAPGAAPTLMGWAGWAVRTTTPPAMGLAGGNSLTLLFPRVATERVPRAGKAQAAGGARPGVRVAVRVPSGPNLLTVVPRSPSNPVLATKTSPLASTASAQGVFSPGRVAVGVVLPGANTLTVPWPFGPPERLVT